MINSMTGFGKAEGSIGEFKVNCQMRSLNSKSMDLNLRLPNQFRELEGDIRKLITQELYRGKVELAINVQDKEASSAPSINQAVFKKYFEELGQIAEELGKEISDPIETICRFPEVFSSKEQELSENDKADCISIIKDCIAKLKEFRVSEGKELEKDLRSQIEEINTQLEVALEFEDERIQNVRSRIEQKLEEHSETMNIDKDRFEQELIYYMEKFDISEEKVRLRSHCQYFLETLESEEEQGKKLNFIAQEIGREINTLGSKANHAEMQQKVVLMKEALEKIKEQVLNIL